MTRNVPIEWLRAIRSGRSAKWIARELLGDVKREREVNKALLGCGGYRV